MQLIKFTNSYKQNEVLNNIYYDLINFENTPFESIQKWQKYKETFPTLKDYNIVCSGTYYPNLHDLYKGYKTLQKATGIKLETIFVHHVRLVLDYIFEHWKQTKD